MSKKEGLSAESAWQRLQDGNGRFVSNQLQSKIGTPERRAELVGGQNPFATIIGCADSRVPPELIFDQNLGDLFVIRVAGNVATPAVIGSVEYAVGVLKTPLVVVLGHTGCGAVAAALAEINGESGALPPHLAELIGKIRISLAEGGQEQQGQKEDAVHLNAQASVAKLCAESPVVAAAIDAQEVSVMGAVYDLESGYVRLIFRAD